MAQTQGIGYGETIWSIRSENNNPRWQDCRDPAQAVRKCHQRMKTVNNN